MMPTARDDHRRTADRIGHDRRRSATARARRAAAGRGALRWRSSPAATNALARASDLEQEAVERIRSLILDPRDSAFRGGTGFFTVTVAGRPRAVVRRGSCCQSFRVDGEFCATCPRVPAAEQRRRVTAELNAATV